MSIQTKRERVTDSKGFVVSSITEEIVGATSLSELEAPDGARNIRKSISEGRATLTYDLGNEARDGSNTSISISATASQEPLATHPMFQSGDMFVSAEEWKLWKQWEKDGVPDPIPDNISDGFAKFIELTNKGVTDYLQPRAVVRVTTSEGAAPSMINLGTINAPSSAPSLPEGGNWLLTSIESQREDSNQWTVTREWTSSGPKGWNEDIYKS